jgi:hypothetical protein
VRFWVCVLISKGIGRYVCRSMTRHIHIKIVVVKTVTLVHFGTKFLSRQQQFQNGGRMRNQRLFPKCSLQMLLILMLQLYFYYATKCLVITCFILTQCQSNVQICVLEAIFGDAVVIFNKKGGQRSFQVCPSIQIQFLFHILFNSKYLIC